MLAANWRGTNLFPGDQFGLFEFTIRETNRMSVYVKFEPEKGSGVIAEGSNLLDTARRLGVQISSECKGLGECDSCVVVVQRGAGLLSSPSPAERKQLGTERLVEDRRLACQTRVERSGELVLMLVPATERTQTVEEEAENFRREFRELPLGRKIKRLAEFEAVSAFEALTTIASLPFTVGERVLDVIADYGRKRESAREATQTTEQGETCAPNDQTN